MTKIHPFLPNLDEEIIQKMLHTIGIKKIDDLFNDIPEELRLRKKLDMQEGINQIEVEKYLEELLNKNKTTPEYISFLGGGIRLHYIPAVVDTIISRGEFYTSYTPYQPEINQGMLQALFEYQSLICDLTGMDIANSSMYDWSTALGEAVRMAYRILKRKKVLVSKAAGPERVDVLETYCGGSEIEIEIERVDFNNSTGQTDFELIEKNLDNNTAAVYVENPNFFGVIEEQINEISEITHKKGALLIVGVDPLSLGLLKSPGQYGADIVIGEGQPLGLDQNYGGPLLGIFAIRDDKALLRQMPGRIIGMTTTKEGNERGFSMVLQTREQHIRRESATSNICTNEALLAVAAASYLSLLGSDGLKELSEKILANSHYVAELLSEIENIKSPYFNSAFFGEFVIEIKNKNAIDLVNELLNYKIFGGLPLQRYYSNLENTILISVSEIHQIDDFQKFAEYTSKVMDGI
jgi:glycine dehydrogenase subunit 1